MKISYVETPSKHLSTAATQKSSRGRPKKTPVVLKEVFTDSRKAKCAAHIGIKQIYTMQKGNYTNLKTPDPIQFLLN